MTPYLVLKFRDAGTPQERRKIYERAGKTIRQKINKKFQICNLCFENPSLRELIAQREAKNRCLQCWRGYIGGYVRHHRFRVAVEKRNLPEHTRICIDCQRPFPSRLGYNLCIWCVEKAQQEAAKRTLGRGPESVRGEHLRMYLNEKYGTGYRASLVPRVPLHEVDVFRSVR